MAKKVHQSDANGTNERSRTPMSWETKIEQYVREREWEEGGNIQSKQNGLVGRGKFGSLSVKTTPLIMSSLVEEGIIDKIGIS